MVFIVRFENEKVRFKILEIELNFYINVMYDWNIIVNGIVIFLDEILEKIKSFLFLSSILIVNVYNIVKFIIYRYI